MKRLPVPFIGQGQNLPTGCESVSAAMVLQYLGFSVTAEEFAREWLPRGRFYRDENGVRHGPDPRRAFVGDPHDPEALGCRAICTMVCCCHARNGRAWFAQKARA